MRIAFVLYQDITSLDLVGVYDPLVRLKSMGFIADLNWDLCAFTPEISDSYGLKLTPTRCGENLAGYDLLVVPGGPGTRRLLDDTEFIAWLRSAADTPLIASVCSGSLLLAGTGFLEGRRATTHPNALAELRAWPGVEVVSERLVEDGKFITAGGVTAGIDLGLYLCRKLAGDEAAEKIRRQMDYASPLPGLAGRRCAHLSRQTLETKIELSLNIDGSGKHDVRSGLPFLDHMLSQIAVHGLFDISLSAQGDLEIDPHHTTEDIALCLGDAFREALGDRKGIYRSSSFTYAMDESLAEVILDFSGRPYPVIDLPWQNDMVGGLPASLIVHFFESFAFQARCTLHARSVYGRDTHHQCEALFKAFGRALDAATQIDPRRAGTVPSSKGVLF